MQFYNFIIFSFIVSFLLSAFSSLDFFSHWITNISCLAFWIFHISGKGKPDGKILFRCWWCVRVGIKKYEDSSFFAHTQLVVSVDHEHVIRVTRADSFFSLVCYQKIIHSLYVFLKIFSHFVLNKFSYNFFLIAQSTRVHVCDCEHFDHVLFLILRRRKKPFNLIQKSLFCTQYSSIWYLFSDFSVLKCYFYFFANLSFSKMISLRTRGWFLHLQFNKVSNLLNILSRSLIIGKKI